MAVKMSSAGVLGCNAKLTYRYIPVFWKDRLSPSSGLRQNCYCFDLYYKWTADQVSFSPHIAKKYV
jgi:hypothetical protein